MNNTFLLKASHYTAPAWLPLEKQRIFRRTWHYVGDASVLRKQPGTVLVQNIADWSVLITCTPSGELKAFHNVCPHRASPFYLESGQYQTQHLVCPYHAWVYTLEGELVGTPARQRFGPTFQCDDFPLQPIRLETWEDFLFICLDRDGPPLLEFLAPIPATVQGYRTAETQLLVSKRYPVACNWKNYHDNTLCDYHVAIAHRNTLHPIQGPIRFYQHLFDHYVNALYTPTTPQWQAKNQTLAHLSDRNRTGFYTFGIFPNLHLLALPNGVLAWLRIDPVTTDTSEVVLEIYGIPGVSPPSDILTTEFEAFMGEDMVIAEGVQRGYASGAYRPGPVNGLESRIVHQQRLILEFLQADTPMEGAKSLAERQSPLVQQDFMRR